MLFVTTDGIPGKELEVLGIVQGSTIQTKNLGSDITQGLKSLVGGELGAYNEMMSTARNVASERMEAQAAKLGADAIVAVRYSTSSIMQSAAEVMVYGTAVKYK